MRNIIIVTALSLAVLPGCKKGNATPRKDNTPATTQKSATPTPTPAPKPAAPDSANAPTSADKGPAVELKLDSVKNQMKFDKTKLTVKTGAKVHLTFHNESTLAVLPHNWVLVKDGTQAAVAAAGLKKGKEAGYIDPGPDVLANTPLAEAGKTVEVTFTAPAPGTYPYICTVPGHYMVMNGQLVVTP